MAADGMVLTNHDHQTRVGILTGEDNVILFLFESIATGEPVSVAESRVSVSR